jgi:hypothetical protein
MFTVAGRERQQQPVETSRKLAEGEGADLIAALGLLDYVAGEITA